MLIRGITITLTGDWHSGRLAALSPSIMLRNSLLTESKIQHISVLGMWWLTKIMFQLLNTTVSNVMKRIKSLTWQENQQNNNYVNWIKLLNIFFIIQSLREKRIVMKVKEIVQLCSKEKEGENTWCWKPFNKPFKISLETQVWLILYHLILCFQHYNCLYSDIPFVMIM